MSLPGARAWPKSKHDGREKPPRIAAATSACALRWSSLLSFAVARAFCARLCQLPFTPPCDVDGETIRRRRSPTRRPRTAPGFGQRHKDEAQYLSGQFGPVARMANFCCCCLACFCGGPLLVPGSLKWPYCSGSTCSSAGSGLNCLFLATVSWRLALPGPVRALGWAPPPVPAQRHARDRLLDGYGHDTSPAT